MPSVPTQFDKIRKQTMYNMWKSTEGENVFAICDQIAGSSAKSSYEKLS